MKRLLVILFAIGSLFAWGQENWEVTEDYTIYFSGTKAEGTFGGLQGKIAFDPAKVEASKFEVSVDVSTIATGNNTKDKHARGESWFDASSFPRIRFVSNEIKRKGSDSFEAIGELDLKGITKPMSILFSFSQEANAGLFTGTMEVNREDFGIEGNFFGFMVGDEFKVELNVPVKKAE